MCRAKFVDKGSKEDIKRLRKWAKKGKVWAMGILAQRYRDGDGVKQSNKKAVELYERAAKGGDVAAQNNLGVFYHQGMYGVTQSDQRSIEFYTLAANQGQSDAQYNLGVYYYNGTCVEQSYSKARELWTKAAAQGDENATKGLKHLDEAGL